jgi:hypothetical protein
MALNDNAPRIQKGSRLVRTGCSLAIGQGSDEMYLAWLSLTDYQEPVKFQPCGVKWGALTAKYATKIVPHFMCLIPGFFFAFESLGWRSGAIWHGVCGRGSQ